MKQYTNEVKNKFFNYFDQKLGLKQSTKGYWRTDCPYCGGGFSFGISMEKSHIHCFKCGQVVSPVALVLHLEHGLSTYQDVYDFFKVHESFERYDFSTKKVDIELKAMELPESFRLLNQGNTLLAKSARNYMKSRGFNIEKLSLKGIGYCTKGKYAGYIIFPIFERGKLIYFQGRKFINHWGPKMNNPPEEEYGISKDSILYNADALFMYNKVYLVESITNAETLGDNASGLLGKTISPYKLGKILKSPCQRISLMLDKDALKWAVGLVMQLVHYKMVKLVVMPSDDDVNKIGKKKAKEIEKSFKYATYNELFRFKLNYENSEFAYN